MTVKKRQAKQPDREVEAPRVISASAVLNAYADECGWSENTQLALAEQFIDSLGRAAGEQFLEYVSARAKGELDGPDGPLTLHSGTVEVEFDPAFIGGDYTDVGDTVRFDVENATDADIELAFVRRTGLRRENIISWHVCEPAELESFEDVLP